MIFEDCKQCTRGPAFCRSCSVPMDNGVLNIEDHIPKVTVPAHIRAMDLPELRAAVEHDGSADAAALKKQIADLIDFAECTSCNTNRATAKLRLYLVQRGD